MKHILKTGVLFCALIFLAAMLLTACHNATQGSSSSREDSQMSLKDVSDQCEKFLRNNDFEKLAELYEDVSDDSECKEEIDQQLEKFVVDAFVDRNTRLVCDVYNGLAETELSESLVDSLLEGAREIAENGYMNYIQFYARLGEAQLYVEELDQFAWDCCSRTINEFEDYHTARTYAAYVYNHCESCRQWLDQFYADIMESFLEQGQYEDALGIYYDMEYSGLSVDNAFSTLLECANECIDAGEYTGAELLVRRLYSMAREKFQGDALYTYRLATLYYFIDEGRFDDARTWANSFYGETSEKLLAVLQEYLDNRA